MERAAVVFCSLTEAKCHEVALITEVKTPHRHAFVPFGSCAPSRMLLPRYGGRPARTWPPGTSKPTIAYSSRFARLPSSMTTAIPASPKIVTLTRWPLHPGHAPLRLSLDNPELIAASKDLFDYPFSDNSPEHIKWLVAKKAELRRTYPGYQYFDRILDKLNVETMMANRVAMGNYLDPKRFHWVFFVDSFLFPLDNSELTARNIDEGVYVPMQEKKLKRELAQAGLNALPGTFPAYLAFVSKILEQNRTHGGVSIKFEIAYFRTLHFDDPPQAEAAKIYDRYHAGGNLQLQSTQSSKTICFAICCGKPGASI